MNKNIAITILLSSLFLTNIFSQVNAPSETNKKLSEEFMELFFEALKHKALENYDKSLEALLKCKQIDSTQPALFSVLGKNYALLEQFSEAEKYLVLATAKDPENEWILFDLFQFYQHQYDYDRALEIIDKLIARNKNYNKYRLELMFEMGSYNEVMAEIDRLDAEYGFSTHRKSMSERVREALREDASEESKNKVANTYSQKDEIAKLLFDGKEEKAKLLIDSVFSDPNIDLEMIENLLAYCIELKAFDLAVLKSESYLELYPAQPFLYCSLGTSLNYLGRPQEALDALLDGIDYVIDNDVLLKDFYAQIINAYEQMGKTKEASLYKTKRVGL